LHFSIIFSHLGALFIPKEKSNGNNRLMKKTIVFIAILMVCASTAAFSYEGRLSFGFEYGNFWENRTDSGADFETYMGSPGVDLAWGLWRESLRRYLV
jgi:hypothetical protein